MQNKIIKDMAKDVTHSICWCDEVIPTVDCVGTAAALYGIGYRKPEWISVGERLPEESGDYLTYHNGVISALMYSAKHKLFNAADSLSEKYSKKHSITVSHWMPLPEAPKGGTE